MAFLLEAAVQAIKTAAFASADPEQWIKAGRKAGGVSIERPARAAERSRGMIGKTVLPAYLACATKTVVFHSSMYVLSWLKKQSSCIPDAAFDLRKELRPPVRKLR
jgi:hypothetical protein